MAVVQLLDDDMGYELQFNEYCLEWHAERRRLSEMLAAPSGESCKFEPLLHLGSPLTRFIHAAGPVQVCTTDYFDPSAAATASPNSSAAATPTSDARRSEDLPHVWTEQKCETLRYLMETQPDMTWAERAEALGMKSGRVVEKRWKRMVAGSSSSSFLSVTAHKADQKETRAQFHVILRLLRPFLPLLQLRPHCPRALLQRQASAHHPLNSTTCPPLPRASRALPPTLTSSRIVTSAMGTSLSHPTPSNFSQPPNRTPQMMALIATREHNARHGPTPCLVHVGDGSQLACFWKWKSRSFRKFLRPSSPCSAP